MSVINGLFLKNLRLSQGKTQREVAAGICAESYLSKIENNITTCSAEMMTCLLAKLDYPYEVTDMLETESVPLRQTLLDWYNTFTATPSARSCYEQFEQLQRTSVTMTGEDLYLFYLFTIRYALLRDDITLAKKYIKRLHLLEKQAYSTETEYFTAKILALYEYNITGNAEQARTYIKSATQCLPLLSLSEHEQHETKLLYCVFYSRSDEAEPFNDYLTTCLVYYSLHSMYESLIKCYMILAISKTHHHDYIRAEQAYEKARQIIKLSNTTTEYGTILHNLGFVHFLQGKTDDGFTLLQQALEHRHDVLGYWSTSLLLVRYRWEENNIVEAKRILAQLSPNALDETNPFHVRYQLRHSLFCALCDQNFTAIIDVLQQLHHVCTIHHCMEEWQKHAMLVGQFYTRHKRYKLASELYHELALQFFAARQLYF